MRGKKAVSAFIIIAVILFLAAKSSDVLLVVVWTGALITGTVITYLALSILSSAIRLLKAPK